MQAPRELMDSREDDDDRDNGQAGHIGTARITAAIARMFIERGEACLRDGTGYQAEGGAADPSGPTSGACCHEAS